MSKRQATLLVLILLNGCASESPKQIIYSGSPTIAEEEFVAEAEIIFSEASPYERARILADILYAAKIAFDNTRLMSPSADNAYDRYLEVLSLDPGNEVAEQGLQNIAQRYIELSDDALKQQAFDQAEDYLLKAGMLDPPRRNLNAARERLKLARKNTSLAYALDPDELSEQSLLIMNNLAEIAEDLMKQGSMFLINARTDDEGRWIYKVMREAVGGYRLRGNIEISTIPNILVIDPASNTPG